jgi:hypothetical protein
MGDGAMIGLIKELGAIQQGGGATVWLKKESPFRVGEER